MQISGKAGMGIGAGIMLVAIVILSAPIFPEDETTSAPTEQSSTTNSESSILDIIPKSGLNKAEIEQMALTNPVINGMIDGEITIYVAPLPSYTSNEIQASVNEFRNTVDMFNDEASLTFRSVNNPNNADIHISWIKNYGSHTVGEAIFKSVVKIGLGKDNCFGDWQPFDRQTIDTILIHELGHSLGFGHSNDPTNVMYYQTDTRFEKDYDSRITLDEGYFQTIEFCNAGDVKYTLKSNDQNHGFKVYVLTPETNSVDFISTGEGKHYPACGSDGKKMVAFTKECDNIPQGSKLVIYNVNEITKFSAINVDILITDLNQRVLPNYTWDMDVFEYDEEYLLQIRELFR